ncbi:MAG TPA: UbiD family decarboxylase domain-containing protein [Arsenophonus nasoniae]|uniref:UbiD family decarboxylase domain-containing protein n=1 Tax=Arsenophonus nasoniae TaxID=638 RepID=UPI003879121C
MPGQSYSRLARHLGLAANSTPKEIIAAIRHAVKAKPIAPEYCFSALVKENIWLDNKLDLSRFPVPLLHAKDGGRYFGTYGFHVIQSPDGKWNSWRIDRLITLDRACYCNPTYWPDPRNVATRREIDTMGNGFWCATGSRRHSVHAAGGRR